MIKTASSKLAAFIACREALVTVAYQDGPNMSIGFGSNSPDLKPGDSISVEDAFKRLKADIAPREKYVASKVKVDLTQSQFDAIVDLYYQNANKNKGTLNVISLINSMSPSDLQGTKDPINSRLLKEEEIDPISLEFEKYCLNSSGNPILGLLTRRRMEIDVFWRGDYGDLSSILVFKGNPRVVKPVSMPFDYESFGG